MRLDANDFIMFQAIIDKEVMPYVTNRINKKHNAGHIKRELDKVTSIDYSIPLLAQLLRQRGVAERKDHRGISFFAISEEFFTGEDYE